LTKKEGIEQQTEQLLEPIMKEVGFELVDVEYVKEGSNWYLRVYIDKPEGITVDDCEVVSRRFSEIIDDKDYVDGSYIFEVSSPGLGRPLKKEKDFIRNLDKEVEVRTYKAIDGEKEFVGYLKEYTEDTITIEDEENIKRTFNLVDTALIRLAIRF
jgi:ribosome maturation factor RimP